MQGVCSNRMKRQQDERNNKPVNFADFSLLAAFRVEKKVNGQTSARDNRKRKGESKHKAEEGSAGQHRRAEWGCEPFSQ